MSPAARKAPTPPGTEPLAPGTPDPEPVRIVPRLKPPADQTEPDEVADEAVEDEQEEDEDEDQPKAIAGLDASTAAISPFGGSQYGPPGIHIDSVTDPGSPKTIYHRHHG